jgi:NADPH:quinone reductase-like Zn-dependent oxidoreductase
MVIGWDFGGTVDAVGEGVTGFDEGTPVWGHLAYTSSQKQGTYAEFITVPAAQLAVKPENVSYHTAAAAATITMTSLQSLRDHGRISSGENVLILGAAGGVGSAGVGIAKRLGARVTGVCSTGNVQLVEALGADEVIDRKKEDFLKSDSAYDIVFDTPAYYSYSKCAKILKPNGTYVTTLPSLSFLTGKISTIFSSRSCRMVQVKSKRGDLELVGTWLSEGLEVPVDSAFKVSDLDSAYKRLTSTGRMGKVVIDVADGWE